MNKKMLALVLAALMSVSTTVVAFAEPVADSVVSSTESDETVAPEADAAITDADALKKAVQKTGTVKLDADIEASIEIPAKAEVTLDLNGHKLTNEAGKHTITNKGALIIIDSVGTGVVDNVSNGKGALVNNGTVTLKSGKLTRSAESSAEGGNTWYVVDNNGGEMNVEGGEIISTSKTSSLIRNLKAEFNMKGGHLKNAFIALKNDDNGVVTVTGGEIETTAVGGSALQNWGKATVSGGTLIAVDGANAIYSLAWSKEFGNSETVVTGDAVIEGNIQAARDDQYPNVPVVPSINIQGGHVNGDVKANLHGQITVSGGEITGTVKSVEDGSTAKLSVTGGAFATKPDEKYVSEDAAQVTVENDGETTYRFGNSATKFEVAEGDTITIVANPKNSKFELAGDEKVTVVNKTDKPVEVNDTTIEAGQSADVNADGEVEERVERDNGGDYFGNEKWAKVKREIAAAEEGDTIKVSATGLPWFPSSVARALKGHDITLEIRKNGTTYSVNGEKIGAIEKIWYEFDQLEEKLLTAEAK